MIHKQTRPKELADLTISDGKISFYGPPHAPIFAVIAMEQ